MAKYDLQAINAYFEQLLDKIQTCLQVVNLYVLRCKIKEGTPLALWIACLDRLESELLRQWQTLQSEGIDALTLQQALWLGKQQKQKDGAFTLWFAFTKQILAYAMEMQASKENVWASYLVFYLSNREEWDMSPSWIEPPSQASLDEQLHIVQTFAEHKPYSLFLEFLSLIEIGAQYRPKIEDPTSALTNVKPSPSALSGAVASLQKGDINQLRQDITAFWQISSGGLLAFKNCLYYTNTKKIETYNKHAKVQFSDLINFAKQEAKLRSNVEAFIQRKPFQHMLLWGARGSGKSMSLHALGNAYSSQGVRLFFLEQDQIKDRFAIISQIAKRKERFIFCIDDAIWNIEMLGLWKNFLDETQNLETPCLVCVVSNRKELIQHGDLDMNKSESSHLLDERLALQDRFGLKLYYPIFDYNEWLPFISQYREKYKVEETSENLIKEIRKFAALQQYDQISKRTIQAFIKEYLKNRTT